VDADRNRTEPECGTVAIPNCCWNEDRSDGRPGPLRLPAHPAVLGPSGVITSGTGSWRVTCVDAGQRHGNSDNITQQDMERAAQASGISVAEAAGNIREAC
jgi:hypothetical protein